MSLANFFIQPEPELPHTLAVDSTGAWTLTILKTDAKAGQRSALFAVGPIRVSNIVQQPITNCRIMQVSALWGQRGAGIDAGVGASDGVLVSSSVGASEANEVLGPGPKNYIPGAGLFGQGWYWWVEALADGLVFCAMAQSVGITPGMDIPTVKRNKPVNVVDAVLSDSTMAYVPPDQITRSVGDFTTQVKPRDDILARMDAFGVVTGRVKSVVAGTITLYAPHGKDSGGNGNGGLVVSQASDGT